MHIKEDTYILSGITSSIEDLITQKKKGFNPGVDIFLKDAISLEIASARLNLDTIEEIKERPGSYHLTGIVSNGFRISDYYYDKESLFEGYISSDEHDICAITISSQYRKPRSYVSPHEFKHNLGSKKSRELYIRWYKQHVLATV